MCAYFYIRFIYFIEKGKKFLDDTNLFFPNEYEKIIKETQSYFNNLKQKTCFMNRF